jgi:hypothetical protein
MRHRGRPRILGPGADAGGACRIYSRKATSMDWFIPLLTVTALLAAWHWFVYSRSGRRPWDPIWMAFSTTAVMALFFVSGLIGFRLDRRERFFAGSSWSDTVVWWQVGAAFVLVPVAIYFWRRAAREVDRRLDRV